MDGVGAVLWTTGSTWRKNSGGPSIHTPPPTWWQVPMAANMTVVHVLLGTNVEQQLTGAARARLTVWGAPRPFSLC